MADYLTEQEQIEILKNWIKQYSVVIIVGIALAVLITSGYHFWQDRQSRIFSHASSVYDEMMGMRVQNNNQAALLQANKILKHYPKLVYGQLAALMIARDAALQGDYTHAATQLNWVIEKSDSPAIRQIARLRLARLFIAQEKPDEALNILNTEDDATFKGLTQEIKGDAYFASKNFTKAREFYRLALTNLPNAQVVRPLLQMKYDNLNE